MDAASLDDLLDRARKQDPDALGELVERYSRRVYGLLYRLTGVPDVAEDLTQETFLRVVRMIGQYEHVGKFESWLFRIAANLVRDRARKHVRRGETASLDEDRDGGSQRLGAGEHPADDPHGVAVRTELRQSLAAGLDRLSDAEREIILLRHYSELSFREIADLLGIPLGTALARAHRALKRLKTILADEDVDDAQG